MSEITIIADDIDVRRLVKKAGVKKGWQCWEPLDVYIIQGENIQIKTRGRYGNK